MLLDHHCSDLSLSSAHHLWGLGMKLLAGVIVSEYAGDLCVCVKLECCFFTLSLLTPRVKKWGGEMTVLEFGSLRGEIL